MHISNKITLIKIVSSTTVTTVIHEVIAIKTKYSNVNQDLRKSFEKL